jgi:folylpolyglutamate synthase/dihydropteroate synthase
MLQEMARISQRMVFTRAANVRSVEPDDLLEAAAELGLTEVSAAGDVGGAIALARELAGEALVCVTGSHYVVGEARDHLLSK